MFLEGPGAAKALAKTMNSEVGEKYVAELIRLFDRHGESMTCGVLSVKWLDHVQHKQLASICHHPQR